MWALARSTTWSIADSTRAPSPGTGSMTSPRAAWTSSSRTTISLAIARALPLHPAQPPLHVLQQLAVHRHQVRDQADDDEEDAGAREQRANDHRLHVPLPAVVDVEPEEAQQ